MQKQPELCSDVVNVLNTAVVGQQADQLTSAPSSTHRDTTAAPSVTLPACQHANALSALILLTRQDAQTCLAGEAQGTEVETFPESDAVTAGSLHQVWRGLAAQTLQQTGAAAGHLPEPQARAYGLRQPYAHAYGLHGAVAHRRTASAEMTSRSSAPCNIHNGACLKQVVDTPAAVVNKPETWHTSLNSISNRASSVAVWFASLDARSAAACKQAQGKMYGGEAEHQPASNPHARATAFQPTTYNPACASTKLLSTASCSFFCRFFLCDLRVPSAACTSATKISLHAPNPGMGRQTHSPAVVAGLVMSGNCKPSKQSSVEGGRMHLRCRTRSATSCRKASALSELYRGKHAISSTALQGAAYAE